MIFPWRVEMFGGLVARQNETVVSKFQTKKTGALFAYLALHPNKTHSRDKVCELVWGSGVNDSTALRNRLNQAVSTLRRQLEGQSSQTSRMFESDHYSLGLTPNMVVTDVQEFEQLVSTAKRETSPAAKIQALEQAASLYKGELLEGYEAAWIRPIRQRLTAVALESLRELIKLHSAAGRPEAATVYAQRAVGLDPGDEQSHTDLISLLIASGRHQAALHEFEILQSELEKRGRTPSSLAKSLRDDAMNQPVQSAVRPVRGEALVEIEASPEAVVAPKARLPVPFTRIVDREKEMSTLQGLLLDKRAKIVSLLGMGGSGKSRLVIELSHRVRDHYSDHVYYVPLLPAAHNSEIVDQISSVVCPGLPNERRDLTALTQSLRTSGPSLIILDTADHLDEKAVEQIAEFSDIVQGLQIVVTSRKSLHLPDETEFTLNALAVPDPNETEPSVIAENPSVQLFLIRAQAVRPDFQVTLRTASAIAKLCYQLEGLPLSLELAAGWARSLSPAQMLEQLGQRLDFLASRRRSVSPRHQTIRAVLESTFEVLPAELRTSFLSLSVFSGGFDHATAAKVCPDADIANVIHDLMESCLIQQSSGPWEQARFTMLNTLREYAREIAEPAHLEAFDRRHAECFIGLAAWDRTDRFETSDEWMLAVNTDYENIVSAMTWLFDHERQDDASQMVSGLVSYWEASGTLHEGISWLEKSLKARHSSKSTKVRCMAGLSRLKWHAGDRLQARLLIRQALSDAYAANDNKALQEVLLLHQLDEHNVGNLAEAERLANEGLAIAIKIMDVSTEARWHVRLGNVAMEKREWQDAREHYEKCLELGRKAGDSTRIASALVNIGHYGIKTGQPEFAKLALQEALEYKNLPGFKFTYWIALANLARAECLAGTPDNALHWLRLALQIQSEDNYVVLDILSASALVANKLGKPKLAAMLLGHTFAMHSSDGIQGLESEARSEIEAEVRQALGDGRFEERFLFGRQLTTTAALDLAGGLAHSREEDAEDVSNAPT